MLLDPVIPTHTNGFCTFCYGRRYRVFTVTIDGVESQCKQCERCREETFVTEDDNLVEIQE